MNRPLHQFYIGCSQCANLREKLLFWRTMTILLIIVGVLLCALMD